MPAFPQNLQEIKERRDKERRPKPLATNDKLTPSLGAKFAQANLKEVKHAHDEDEVEGPAGPKSVAQQEFLKLDKFTQNDLKEGKFALDEIQKWIVGETSRLLDKINQGLADFNEAGSPAASAAAQDKYEAATKAFNDFVSDLNNPEGTSFGATINAANIEPIQSSGGYYTSARVIIQWLGGTHSGSSLVHVP
jgi:hypothetical protein